MTSNAHLRSVVKWIYSALVTFRRDEIAERSADWTPQDVLGSCVTSPGASNNTPGIRGVRSPLVENHSSRPHTSHRAAEVNNVTNTTQYQNEMSFNGSAVSPSGYVSCYTLRGRKQGIEAGSSNPVPTTVPAVHWSTFKHEIRISFLAVQVIFICVYINNYLHFFINFF